MTREGNIEVFTVPDDYPYVEQEDGKCLIHGVYFWYTDANSNPNSYACGPYPSVEDALEDAQIGAAL